MLTRQKFYYLGLGRRIFAPSERAWMTLDTGSLVPIDIERFVMKAKPELELIEIVGARLGDLKLTCSYYPPRAQGFSSWWFDPQGFRGFPVAPGQPVAVELVNHASVDIEVSAGLTGMADTAEKG